MKPAADDTQPRAMAHPATLESPTFRGFWPAVIAATLLAAALRLFHLDTGSFWLDELYTIRTLHDISEGNWQWIKVLGYLPSYIGVQLAGVDLSAIDRADPSTWRDVGVTEFVARFPTALVGILSVPLLAAASRPMLGLRGAAILALLLAVSPWHIYWSQAARFYVVQFLFYNLALALYFGATRPLSRWRFVLALGMAVLAFMSQPTSLVLGAVLAIDWVFAAATRGTAAPVRLGAFGWTAAAGAIGFCGLLFVVDTYTGRTTIDQTLSEPLGQTPQGLVLAAGYLIWPGVAAFAMCAGLWLWRRERRMAVFLGGAAVIPILFFAAISVFLAVGSRYSFVCAFGWIALAAAGIDRIWILLRPRVGLALAAAPLAALVAGSLLASAIAFKSGGNLHARWRDAARVVEARRQPGDPVYASTPYIAAYYLGEPALPLPPSPEEVAAIPTEAWFIVHRTGHADTSRFWLLPDAELVDYFSLNGPTGSPIQVYRHTPRALEPRDPSTPADSTTEAVHPEAGVHPG